MARKKKEEVPAQALLQEPAAKPTPKLTTAQYWEFKSSIADLDVAMKDVEISKLAVKIREMELSVAKNKVNEASIKYINAKKEYDRFLSELEKEVGTTIKGKIIDPITFSITSENDIVIPD